MTILAVTGLKREAEIAGGVGVVAVAGGGDAKGLAEKLDALHGDIKGVISFGLAGGLSPLLKVGEIIVADQVISGSEQWRCHERWRVTLAAKLAGRVGDGFDEHRTAKQDRHLGHHAAAGRRFLWRGLAVAAALGCVFLFRSFISARGGRVG